MTAATTNAAEMGFGPKKTVIILAVVAGCFAVLWPKIFYPMLTASYAPPPPTADSTGCCDVIFESDVTAVDIMQELCHNIIKHHQVDPRVRDAIETSKFNKLSPSSVSVCREEVLARCGIDLSSFLAEKERLKKSYKQVLEEIRGFNGSLCLKMQFGVPLSRLGTPHLIRYHILMPHSTIRQERSTPPHAGNYHPALRERGRAIPSSHIMPKIPDRPDHIAPMKMRPPMGAGHVVSAPKGQGSLGVLMPLYTVGIVIFFIYTISKVLMGIIMPLYTIGNVVSLLYKVLQILRKSTDSEIIRPEYSTAAIEREYQKLVFNPETFAAAVTASNKSHFEKPDRSSSPTEESASTIDDLREHQDPKSKGLAAGVNAKESNVLEVNEDDKELEEYHETTPTMKVLNMEMTASCEGGQKRSRPSTPILVTPQSQIEDREKTPPVSIYLEGALPPQCELLVTESKTQEIQEDEDVEVPVVLSGKMTLSLISLDQESQENEQVESTAAHRITSSSPENSSNESDEKDEINIKKDLNNKRIEVLRKVIKDSDNEDSEEEEEEEEEEEGTSESASEADIDDNIDDTINVKKSKKPSDHDTLQESMKQKYSKKFIDNSEEEYVESDDDDSNEVLFKTIQREKSRKLEFQEKNNRKTDDEVDEETEEDEEDEEEEEELEEEEEEEEYENEELEEEEGEYDEEEEEEEVEEEEYEDQEIGEKKERRDTSIQVNKTLGVRGDEGKEKIEDEEEEEEEDDDQEEIEEEEEEEEDEEVEETDEEEIEETDEAEIEETDEETKRKKIKEKTKA